MADLTPEWEPMTEDDRLVAMRSIVERKGQGTFRLRVVAAYGGRCAVTRERALPTLDAAHIQPYLGPASNHVQNGLLLRADLHRLYDAGYLAVTPDLRLEVSRRLRDDFDTGEEYYRMAGSSVIVPGEIRQQPSRQALEWHAEHVFR